MSWPLAIAIYFVLWWTVLFIVLPFGVRTQQEEQSIIPGSSESAPALPGLRRKVLMTTLLAAVAFAIVYWLMVAQPFRLEDIPLLGRI